MFVPPHGVTWDPYSLVRLVQSCLLLSLTMGSAFTPQVYCHSAASSFLREGRQTYSRVSAVTGWLCGVHVPFPDDGITHETGRSRRIMLMTGEGLMEAVVVLVYCDWRTNKKVVGKLPGACSRPRATAEWSTTFSGLDATSVTYVVETVMG
ncbi:hypothetical protein F4604DRAFT_325370 [Suillus subluteus]|nr:hypothetical protein F4604DRAFT_325370 [Suillus subluteus]